MDSRKAGGLFLTQIVVSIGVSLWLSFGNPGFTLEIIPNLIFSQMLLLLPALLFLLIFREKPTGIMCFRLLRPTTCLWIFLFTFLMTPLIVAVNAFSMIFTDNVAMEISGDVLKQPLWLMVLIMGILGPFCEEFVFRGILFGSFRKSGRPAAAIVLQALLFGLVHLNFNQFCYAFVIGIALGMLVEVTGSIWSGFLMHASVNAPNVLMMYLSDSLTEQMGMETSYTSDMMMAAMCVYMVIALVTTSIAACVMVAIAKNEGKEDRLRRLFTQKAEEERVTALLEPVKKDRLISASTVIAIIICCTFMLALEILEKMLSS